MFCFSSVAAHFSTQMWKKTTNCRRETLPRGPIISEWKRQRPAERGASAAHFLSSFPLQFTVSKRHQWQKRCEQCVGAPWSCYPSWQTGAVRGACLHSEGCPKDLQFLLAVTAPMVGNHTAVLSAKSFINPYPNAFIQSACFQWMVLLNKEKLRALFLCCTDMGSDCSSSAWLSGLSWDFVLAGSDCSYECWHFSLPLYFGSEGGPQVRELASIAAYPRDRRWYKRCTSLVPWFSYRWQILGATFKLEMLLNACWCGGWHCLTWS